MPVVLDKAVSKQEEFVEKQIEQARSRIRTLDYFSAGLTLLIGTLAFLLAVLLIDRYVELPAGAGWAAATFYLLSAAGFLYLTLFRPSRRHINPYYAAVKVEQNIDDAKNSVVSYVDLKDDEKVPGSVMAAIGTKAAKDLKHVDLARAIQRKQIVWLAVVAGLFFIAALVVAFLPPTRTTLALLQPKEGDVTVVQGNDVRIEAKVGGYVPDKGTPDAPRVRLWYNPEDPGSYEERPLEAVEDQKNVFGLTVPAKQVRNGFRYRVIAGAVHTPDYEVKVRIIPQFMSWEVQYQFPDYLKRQTEKTGDPNLVAYYGTQVTVTAYTNKPVRSGRIEIDGQIETIPGQLVDDTPEAVRFQFTMKRNSNYRVRFVTSEGEGNPDPQRFRIALIDPKPMFLRYDVTYDYPKYLRYEPSTLTFNVKDPHLEAMRGTKVTLIGHANREVKSAQVEFPGQPQPILAEAVEGQPTQAKFTLPPLTTDGAYRIAFSPKSDEQDSDPRVYNVRIINDDVPKVVITKPEQELIELPTNGTLAVEGIATDEIGLDTMNLRMQVISPEPMVLEKRAYRGGKSFRRDGDETYPTRIDYKDFVALAAVRAEGEKGAAFRLQPEMIIEYWLEAIDNCDTREKPAYGISLKQRVKILPPEMAPDKKKQQDQRQQDLDKDKRQHEQQQDQKNANEKRDAKQPPQQGEPKEGDRKKEGDPMGGKMGDAMADAMNEEELRKEADQVKAALDKKNPPAKVEPKNGKTEEPKPDDQPKADPKQLPKPEDFEKLAEQLKSEDPKEREKAREQLKKMMEQASKDPPKSSDAEKKNDEHRDKLTPEQQKKFDKAMEEIAKEMQNLQREEKVQKAAEKAMSNDPKEREQGQRELENMMRNSKTRKDVENQLQRLAGGQTEGERKQRLDDAMDLSRKNIERKEQAKKDDTPTEPKPKKEDVDELAKKINKGNQQEKQEAQDRLEKMMKKDKATREQVQKQLDEFKKNINSDEERQNFEESMKQIEKNLAKEEGKDKKPTAEDVEKFAKQLTSDNENERKEAKQKLEDALKKADQDPKARAQAQQQLKDFRDGIKDDTKKERFDQAMKQINEAVEQHRRDETAARQKEVDQLAKDLNDKNPAKQMAAQQKLEEMLRDPDQKDAVKEQMEKIKDGLTDESAKKNIDQAMQKAGDNIAKKDPAAKGKGPSKEEVEKLAQDLNSGDAGKQLAAQKKLEEMLRDPKTRDAVKEQMEKIKDGLKDETAKKNIDDAMQRAEKTAKKDGSGQPSKDDIEKLAKDLNSTDPAKRQEAQDKLEKMLEDPKNRQTVKDQLDKLKEGMTAAAKQNIDDAVRKAEQNLAKKDGKGSSQVKPEDIAKLAEQLQKGTAEQKQQARQELEKLLQEPKTKAEAEKELNKIRDGLPNDQAKKEFDDAIDQIKKSIAKGGKEQPKKGEAPTVTQEEIDKIVKGLLSKDPKDAQKAQKDLEDILKDPKKREEYDKLVAEMLKDPQKREQFRKATEELVKSEIEKITEKLKSQKPEEKLAAKEKLEELIQKSLNRDLAEKELEEFGKDIQDKELRDEFEKQLKEIEAKLAKKDRDAKEAGKKGDLTKHDGKKPGDNTTTPAEPAALAELRNKTKAGELLLEEFKKQISDEEFRKSLGWTPEQIERFRKRYEQQLAELKKQLELSEKGEMPQPRVVGPSPLDRGPEKINLDGKDGANPLQGGRGVAPPGFAESYKNFTEQTSGVTRPPAPIAPPKK